MSAGTTDQILEATRDLIGIVRAMWLIEREPHKKTALAGAGRELAAALEVFRSHELGTPEYSAAEERCRVAMNAVHGTIHMNSQNLGPLVGSAAARLRKLQGRI